VFASIIVFSRVVAAAAVPCWSRAIDWLNAARRASRQAAWNSGILSQEGIDPNAGGFGGFLDVPLGEQRSDRLFLLAPEFRAVSYHLPPSATA
jgi:hypothetical protein